MRCEFRQCPAAWHRIAEHRDLRHVATVSEENALPSRRVQHGRVEGYLTARIDRCDDRLRGDVEPIEPTAAGHCETGVDSGT